MFKRAALCVLAPFVGALLALPLYWPRISDYFLSDDFDILHWAIRRSLWEGLVHPPWSTWLRPVTDVLWQTTAVAFGTDPSPHHLVNIMLHVANATLVGLLALRFSGSKGSAFAAATFFAVCPTSVAVVQWLAGRYDLLAVFFSLSALHLGSMCAENQRTSLAAVSVGCAILALLSKESAVALPFVALAFSSVRLRWSAAGQLPFPRTVAFLFLALLPFYFAIRWWLFDGLGGYGWHGKLSVAQLLNPLLCLPLITVPVYIETPLDGASSILWILAGGLGTILLMIQTPFWMAGYLASFIPIANMMGTLGFRTDEVARLMYFPTAFVAANAGTLCGAMFSRFPRVATASLALVIIVSMKSSMQRLDAWREASQLTAAVSATLINNRSEMRLPALVDCSALPDNVRGAWAYRTGCDAQIRLVVGEGLARGFRGGDTGIVPQFASVWCLSPDGSSVSPRLCH